MAEMASYYATSANPVRAHFSRYSNVHVLEGDGRDTVSNLPDKLAFVHVDLNSPALEIQLMGQLWPDLVTGAIILLDDYANNGLRDSYNQMSNFFAGLNHQILTTASGQGIVVKAGP